MPEHKLSDYFVQEMYGLTWTGNFRLITEATVDGQGRTHVTIGREAWKPKEARAFVNLCHKLGRKSEITGPVAQR